MDMENLERVHYVYYVHIIFVHLLKNRPTWLIWLAYLFWSTQFQGSTRWTRVREGLTKRLEHQSASTRHSISVQCISSNYLKAFIEYAAVGGSFSTCSAKKCQTEDNGTTQIKVHCNLAQDLWLWHSPCLAMPPVFSRRESPLAVTSILGFAMICCIRAVTEPGFGGVWQGLTSLECKEVSNGGKEITWRAGGVLDSKYETWQDQNCQKSGSSLSFDVFAGSEIKTFKPAQQDGCRLVKEEHGSFMT